MYIWSMNGEGQVAKCGEVDRRQAVKQTQAWVAEEEDWEEDNNCFLEDLGSNERNNPDDSNGKSW